MWDIIPGRLRRPYRYPTFCSHAALGHEKMKKKKIALFPMLILFIGLLPSLGNPIPKFLPPDEARFRNFLNQNPHEADIWGDFAAHAHAEYDLDFIIHYAAMGKSLKMVKELIACGIDPNLKSESGRAPLHYSAMFGSKEISEILIENKANINLRSPWGVLPIHYACETGDTDFVALFINNGSEKNCSDMILGTPLAYAVKNEDENMVEFLLKNKFNPNISDTMRGFYPIHHSIYCKRSNILLLLLNAGANPNSLNKNGQSPLHLAYLRKDREKVYFLLSHMANEDQKCRIMQLKPIDYQKLQLRKRNGVHKRFERKLKAGHGSCLRKPHARLPIPLNRGVSL